MAGRHPYKDAIKIQKKKRSKKKKDATQEMQKWRAEWKEAGPIEFAEKVLLCWPEVPPHPELGRVPEHNILSEDQKKLLYDLWKGGVTHFILAAGRGAGKTYTLALYACWRIVCFDYFSLTVMGGSSEQSVKIKEYIDFWRTLLPEIFYCLPRSVESTKEAPHIESRWGAKVRFPACSEAGSRGPHVTQVLIDEVCVGESKGKDGRKAVRAARFQTTGSPEAVLGYISTAQYILGTFYRIWKNYKKLGFKRYRWSIARHVSPRWFKKDGKTPDWTYIDEVLYEDRNPENWVSAVWWETTENIQALRRGGTDTPDSRSMTDDEWLVEVLGGISRGTGLVFGRDDLEACICRGNRYTEDKKECEICKPYTDKCPAMKALNIPSPYLASISSRKAGIDFGDPAPNALTVTGMRGRVVFVLYNDERVGLRSTEVTNWADGKAKEFKVWEIFGDPEERGSLQALEDKGYVTPNIWKLGGGAKKGLYVTKSKRFVEYHRVFLPKKFVYLCISMEELSYDARGGILKHNDHSYDSFIYSIIDYDPEIDSQAILKELEGKILPKIWN